MGERGAWRSLEERDGDAVFAACERGELPPPPAAWPEADGVARRHFLQLMGASLGLAGLTACTKQPTERIAPYVDQPEEVVPGRPLFFATAMTLAGSALPVLVESHEGRPTEIEGNPDHPASLGATDLFAQATVLDLYDPDRAQAVTRAGEIRPYADFIAAAQGLRNQFTARRGAGLHVLTETLVSPTLGWQIGRLLAEWPEAAWHAWEPAVADSAEQATRLVFGAPLRPRYHLARADVILTLDADFLADGADAVRLTREFAARRRPESGMSRLYAVETTPGLSGARADHRLALRPSEVEPFARAVAAGVLALAGVDLSSLFGVLAPSAAHASWIAAVVRDLWEHRGRCLVLPGAYQPPVIHALAQALNHVLGNDAPDASVAYLPGPPRPEPQSPQSLERLCVAMEAGQVSALLILGGNPVYSAPADLRFGQRLRRVTTAIHLSSHLDETAVRCQWHIPEAHFLEAWSDARLSDGSASIVQPLIAPLHGGRSSHEVLAALSAQPAQSGYDIVRDFWRTRLNVPEADFEIRWRRALHSGSVEEPAVAVATPALQAR